MIHKENEFVNILVQYLVSEKFKVWQEVPNMGQSADLVASKEERLIFIEAKLKNWERAIQQCKAHELVADYIYIAIATKKVSPNFKNKAEKLGYGIIHFDNDEQRCNLTLKAKENNRVWKPQRAILKTNLKRICYAS